MEMRVAESVWNYAVFLSRVDVRIIIPFVLHLLFDCFWLIREKTDNINFVSTVFDTEKKLDPHNLDIFTRWIRIR